MLNDPVNLLDPWGLWSFSLEGYYGWGGGIQFGQNPDGKYFLNLHIGYGLGAGLNYDIEGKSPNYTSEFCYGFGAGVYGGANIDVGPLTIGYSGNAGATTGAESIPQSLFSNQGPGIQFNNNAFGLGGSIAIGGEFIFIW